MVKNQGERNRNRQTYAVLSGDGETGRPEWSELSHAEAMTLAEKLQRDGQIARVMHVVGGHSYEVDRYPAR
jgi:hypothetical protein